MPFKSDSQRKFLFENKPEIAREFAKKVYAFGGFADDNNDKMYDLAQRMQQKEFKINKSLSKMGILRYGGFKNRKKYQGPEAGDLTSKLITGEIGSKEQLKASIPTERAIPEVEAGPAAEIITEHDKNWDYKKEGGVYSTKEKTSDEWITPVEKSSAGQGIRAVFGDSDYDYVSDWEERQPSTTVPSLPPGGVSSISMPEPSPETPVDDYRQYEDKSLFGKAKDYMRDKIDMVGDIELPSFSDTFNQVSNQLKEGIDDIDIPGSGGLIDRAREFASNAKKNIQETGDKAVDWVQEKTKNIDIIPDHIEDRATNIYSKAIRKANELKDNLVDDMKTLPQNMKERGTEAVSDMQKQLDNLNRVIEKGEQNIEQAVSEKLDTNLFTRKILPVLKSVDVSKLQELPDDLRERIMKNESIDIDSLPTVDKVKIYNAFNNIKQETQSFGGQLSDAGKDVINTISDTGKSYYNKLKDKISEFQTTVEKPKGKKFVQTGTILDIGEGKAYDRWIDPVTGEHKIRKSESIVGKNITGKNPVPYSAILSRNWKNEDGSYKTFDIPGHGQMTGPEAKKLYNQLGGGSTPEGIFLYNKKVVRDYSKKDKHGNFVYPTVTLEDGTEIPATSKLTAIDDPTLAGNIPRITGEDHYTRLYEINPKTGEKEFVMKTAAASHPIPKSVYKVRNDALNDPDIANNLSAGCPQRNDCHQTELIQWVHNPATGVDTLQVINSITNPKDGLLLKQHLKEIDEGKHTKKQRKTIVERILALLD